MFYHLRPRSCAGAAYFVISAGSAFKRAATSTNAGSRCDLLRGLAMGSLSTGTSPAMAVSSSSMHAHSAARALRRNFSAPRAGSIRWLKVKNPAAPAVKRESEEDWGAKRNSHSVQL